VVVGSLREAHDGSDCRGAFGFEPPAAWVVTASLSMKATNYITRTVDRTSQPGGYAIPSDRVEISWPDGGFPTPPRGAKVVTMTATPEQLAESTTHKAERGDIRAPHSGASTRIHRVATGVGIVVGGVVIAGAIFLFGLLIGSQWSAGWDQGGGGGGWSDEWYESPEDGDWDAWSFDDYGFGEPGAEGSAEQPTTAPTSPSGL
jgi:hypothetical protein